MTPHATHNAQLRDGIILFLLLLALMVIGSGCFSLKHRATTYNFRDSLAKAVRLSIQSLEQQKRRQPDSLINETLNVMQRQRLTNLAQQCEIRYLRTGDEFFRRRAQRYYDSVYWCWQLKSVNFDTSKIVFKSRYWR